MRAAGAAMLRATLLLVHGKAQKLARDPHDDAHDHGLPKKPDPEPELLHVLGVSFLRNALRERGRFSQDESFSRQKLFQDVFENRN